MSEGVLYINNGEGFVREAAISARSVKENNPNLDIAIVTDREEVPGVFDQHIQLEDPNTEVISKVLHMDKSPFDRTLFLDSDIYIEDDISELFEVLDEFDLAVSYASRQKNLRETIPEAFPFFNSGVIAFRKNSETEKFLDRWKENYLEEAEGNSEEVKTDEGLQRMPVPDQPSFRETLYSSELRICPLTMRYNCRHGFLGYVDGKVKAFHGRLTDIVDSSGRKEDHQIEKVVQKINSTERKRVFYKERGQLRIKTDRPWLPSRIKNFVEKEGTKGVIEKIKDVVP